MEKRTYTIVQACWLALATIIVAIVAFCHFPDQADWKWCIPLEGRFHLPMMAAGLTAILLIGWLCLKCCRSEVVHRTRLLLITGVLAIIHTILVYSYYLFTDWDVQQLTGLAEAMATGQPIDEFYSYFRRAPNNLLLARIFAAIFFVTGPLWGLRVSLFPLLALQCIGAAFIALMLFQTAMHIWHDKRYAVTAYIFYTLLVWLSPWWSIPYSDIWGLMLAVLILWIATTLPFRRRWLRIFVVAALTAIGYYIKPQVVFVSLSLLVVQLTEHFARKENFKSLLKPTGIAVGGIVSAVLLAHLAVAGCGLHLHTSKGFGPSHYLMMGANYQSIGIYSAQDVDFSRSFPNKKERRQAELAETWHRYKTLKTKGTLTLWGRKTLLNFSDGTFYWGREGSFYKLVPERHGPLSQVTRNVYYSRDYEGRNNKTWSVVMTSLWFGLLLLTAVSAWPFRRLCNKKDVGKETARPATPVNTSTLTVIMMSVILLTLFHTLCEARARYLFCLLPFFILLAVEGLRRCRVIKER